MSSPRVLMIGVHHLDLPDRIHERIAVALERVAHEELDGPSGADAHDVRERILLRTCARSELYLVTSDPARSFRHVSAALAEDLPPEVSLESHLRFASSAAAARHLFRTAAGLESAILGEVEVLGQVADALEVARSVGTAGPLLQRLFQNAIEVGRAIRSETGISEGIVSLASASVDWAERELEADDPSTNGGPVALVVGAGSTGRSVARRLAGGPWAEIHVANRTLGRAVALAEEVDGEGHRLEDLPDLLPRADAVFSAVRVDEPLLRHADMERARQERPGALRLVVDLSHPHGVEVPPSGANHRHLDLASLQTSIRDARAERARWIPDVEARVDDAVEDFMSWARGRGSVPLLIRFRERILEQAMAEAEHLSRGCDPEEAERLRRMARSIARTILHQPTLELRATDPEAPEGRAVVEAVERLFDLASDATSPTSHLHTRPGPTS